MENSFLINTVTTTDCGPYVWTITNADTTPLISPPFTHTGGTNTLLVHATTTENIKAHPLTATVQLANYIEYAEIIATIQFDVTIISDCSDL